jgi:hypothetical protein
LGFRLKAFPKKFTKNDALNRKKVIANSSPIVKLGTQDVVSAIAALRALTPRRSFQMEPERQEYKGHSIELRAPEGREERVEAAEREEKLELLIDDESVRYGQLPDGRYALEEYAYDWTDDLIDLAQRFIDYRDRSDEIRRQADSGEEG